MATIGYKVNSKNFTYVSDELEKKGVSYGIWNAAEFWFGKDEYAEITVESELDAVVLKQIIDSIKISGE